MRRFEKRACGKRGRVQDFELGGRKSAGMGGGVLLVFSIIDAFLAATLKHFKDVINFI